MGISLTATCSRAAKFRIYPTAAQEAFLWAQWGAVRKCWIMAPFLKKHYYRTRGVSLDLIHEIKPLIA
ncbi:helix-turn-helix domain-containing protein [Sutterella seckii]|uniref:Helix-turn-helix domain-containing protein n=1 Tax=Sutterella seckii TaxID=1944635 RepID=A0A6I1ELS3_9BURK|nr:helix-turn-helix domain-containing protein [Sutterella seckii]